MTAIITVGPGCAAQTGWSTTDGALVIDLGIIEGENDNISTGFEAISISMTTSEDVLGMNILGQTRSIKIRGKKTGTLAVIRNFNNNLKLVANYQLQNASDSTIRYYNTNSKLPSVYSSPGIKCMFKDISFDDNNTNSPGEIRYTLTITQTKGLT